jgi:branched-chain amino acid transport system substrate-binding protein
VLATDATRARLAMAAARSQPCAAHYVVFSETGAALSERPAGRTGRHPLAGLMVTQVVPHPNNALHPVALEYQRALAVHGTGTGSHASLEGYLAARVVQEALRPCTRDPSRSCLLQSLAARTFDLPGMRVQFGASQRLARPFVEITMLDSEGRFRR